MLIDLAAKKEQLSYAGCNPPSSMFLRQQEACMYGVMILILTIVTFMLWVSWCWMLNWKTHRFGYEITLKADVGWF